MIEPEDDGCGDADGGHEGVGASVVNALSVRLDVEVNRDGQTWGMSFRRGEPGVFESSEPEAKFRPFEDNSELRKLGKVAKSVTGTKVRYWPDRQIFDQSAVFSIDDLKAIRLAALVETGRW